MKLTNQNFQLVVRIGSIVLFLSTAANVYFLLRYREVYRDASRIERVAQQEAMKQQLVESLLRDFAGRASTDAGVAEIFNRYRNSTNATNNATSNAQP